MEDQHAGEDLRDADEQPEPAPKRLGEELEPGKAALIVLVRQMSADKVLPQIKIPGTVIQTSLSNDNEQRLQEALDAARG